MIIVVVLEAVHRIVDHEVRNDLEDSRKRSNNLMFLFVARCGTFIM